MNETPGPKSVVTCDLEGRIETFSKGAEEIFGYSPDEVLGRKRVSLFSPGEVVLGHVNDWLKAAREEGEHRGRTVFLRRDGTPFAADIRITPTHKDGEHVGYCGVTVPRPDVDPKEAMPRIGVATKIITWMVITRAPFLAATAIPVLVAAAWVALRTPGTPFPWGLFGLVLLGALLLHVAANTFNDYFDWKSGTDQANNDYFLPFSGGSRSLELGLISERGLLRVALTSLGLAALVGIALTFVHGPGLLVFGAVGAASAYFYTAPPLRLCARKGLGELFVGLNFGPLMVGGAVFALTGHVTMVDFVVGLPIGLLTTAILWINQFPDAPADEATGKHHLVVVLGKERARWGYLLLLAGAFASVIAGVVWRIFPLGMLAILAALPIAAYATVVLFRHHADRTLVRANAATIQLHMLAGLLMAAGLLGAHILGSLGVS